MLDRNALTSVREYVAAEAVPRQLALPENLNVSSMYRPLLEKMLHQSPTFRRQCARIAGEPRMTVELRVGTPGWRSGVRATTQVKRLPAGRLHAIIDILPLDDTIELIAHEFEHVIEQLDGIDLAARADVANSGVRSIGHTTNKFETTRAQRTGLKVVSELRP